MKNYFKKIIAGGFLFFISITVPLVFVIPLFFQGESFVLQAPGSLEISIRKPGKYVLWNNYNTVFGGQSYSFGKELPGGLSFSLVGKSSLGKIPFQTSTGMLATSGGEEKVSVGYFEVTNAGSYVLTVKGNAEKRIFSFEKSLLEKVGTFLLALIFGSFLAFVGSIVAVVSIIQGVTGFVRERKTADSEGQTLQ